MAQRQAVTKKKTPAYKNANRTGKSQILDADYRTFASVLAGMEDNVKDSDVHEPGAVEDATNTARDSFSAWERGLFRSADDVARLDLTGAVSDSVGGVWDAYGNDGTV